MYVTILRKSCNVDYFFLLETWNYSILVTSSESQMPHHRVLIEIQIFIKTGPTITHPMFMTMRGLWAWIDIEKIRRETVGFSLKFDFNILNRELLYLPLPKIFVVGMRWSNIQEHYFWNVLVTFLVIHIHTPLTSLGVPSSSHCVYQREPSPSCKHPLVSWVGLVSFQVSMTNSCNFVLT